MVTTEYIFRLTVILPAVRKPLFVAWAVANLGEDWAGSFAPELVPAAGPADAPATHYWSSFACTSDMAKKLLSRLTGQASLMQPGQWDSWTRDQKKDWLLARRVEVRNAIGVEIAGSDNDGEWESPDVALANLGLKVRSTGEM